MSIASDKLREILSSFLALPVCRTVSEWENIASNNSINLLERKGKYLRYANMLDGGVLVYHESGLIQTFILLLVSTGECWGRDEEQWNTLSKQYTEFFTDAVAQITSTIGPPEFVGEPNPDGNTEDEYAAFLVGRWRTTNRDLLLKVDNEDIELPFMLSLVVTPK